MQIKRRSCFKCKYEADTAETICPRCRRPLFSSTNIRIRGGVLVFIGGFLIALMGAISLWMYGVMFHPEAQNGSRFTGTESELAMIAGVFSVVFLFGFTSVAAGLWQLIFGRRNMILVWAIIGLAAAFMICGQAVRIFLD